MFRRAHIISGLAALVLAGAAAAQSQTPPGATGQSPPDMSTRSPTGSPMGNPAGNPGAVPSDMQMDPYAVDKDFLKDAMESSTTQVQLGNLAWDKGSSDAVKELGKQMAEAHTQTGEQLKKAADQLKVPVSAEPSRKTRKAEDKLAKLSGTDFDRTYTKMSLDEQKQAVKQFQREASNGRIPALKEFAARNLPAEQERQKKVEELAGGTQSADRRK